jgi:hypothetical protein
MNHDDYECLLKLLMTFTFIFIAMDYDQLQWLYQPLLTKIIKLTI